MYGFPPWMFGPYFSLVVPVSAHLLPYNRDILFELMLNMSGCCLYFMMRTSLISVNKNSYLAVMHLLCK